MYLHERLLTWFVFVFGRLSNAQIRNYILIDKSVLCADAKYTLQVNDFTQYASLHKFKT